jgi:RNA polymerase sigma-70 factor (ECF subfamily)
MGGPSDQKDEDLASLIQSGRIEFFGILMGRYEAKILRYAQKFLYNNDDAKDAVQEIFTKVYVNIQSFDAKRKFSSWLYRLAHNELINTLSKKRHRSFLPLFDLDIFLPHLATNNTKEEIDNQEFKKVIDACLEKLDAKYKEPIILYYLEDLSYKEIAQVIQIPISTVSIRIKRAKRLMKTIFEKQGYNHGK